MKNRATQNGTKWFALTNWLKFFQRYIKKGARVYISGRIKTSKWQDANNENRYMTEIIVDELIMLDAKTVA